VSVLCWIVRRRDPRQSCLAAQRRLPGEDGNTHPAGQRGAHFVC